uniref:Phospholipid/glycerol acyltransferase domain-containing protein n=1 Tax=Arcella intermedia TaxID=1963864 RepID=A0A6B2L0W6_9EUKA
MTATFFRTITVDDYHLEEIPPDAAVVFVGNHQNQFMDAALLLGHCPRSVGFLVAQKSMKGVIGFFARLFNSIPVARPQDTAKNGPGTITFTQGSNVLTGVGTKFITLNVGKQSICPKGEDPIRVKEVVSDTELILLDIPKKSAQNVPYKIFDKMDQSQVYSEVWKRLEHGGSIGIFPEGGSHDRTELLPLKAGVALMALGAMAKSGVSVYVVPCGLNYFSGHRFRGSVLLEFGRPYRIPESLAETYKKDQRKACGELLETIKQLMETVIIHAPDRETLELMQLVRKIYQPPNVQLTTEQYISLNQRFLAGFQKYKDRPEIQLAYQEVLNYKNELANLGLKDNHIEDSHVISGLGALWLVSVRFVLCVVVLVLALPGSILNSPIMFTARRLALKHQKEALAASEVKVAGLDVVASKKVTISLVLTPPLYISYAAAVGYYYGYKAAIASFFGLFLLSGATIRFAEEGLSMFRSLLAIFKVRWIGSKITDLGNKRRKIQQTIRELVAKMGPHFAEDFEDWRIIKEDQLKDEKSAKPKVTLSGRASVPYKSNNSWDSESISDVEWREIKDIQEFMS